MSNQPKLIVDQRKVDQEGYVHQVTFDPRLTSGQLAHFFAANQGMVGMMQRVCDGCSQPVKGNDFAECACANDSCRQHYDLCGKCKISFSQYKCPAGYGCGNIN